MLPRIDTILYDITIPSTKQQIKVRQLRAKDEKILLMAKTGNSNDDILKAIIQVINNSIVTPGIDVEKLAIFDI